MSIRTMGFLRAVVFVFVGPCLLWGQMTTATISGVAKDQTGAVVPGVAVTVRNVDTGLARTTTTNERGLYVIPNLNPGHYEVEAALAGFQTYRRSGIALTVGSTVAVDIALQVGAAMEIITVTEEAPVIETTTSTVSGLVSERTIRELPLNGRSYDSLATLQVAVVPFNYNQTNAVRGRGQQFSVSGSRATQNQFLLDGMDITEYGGATPGSVAGVNLGVEAIREFQILTSNFPAEYGRSVGGVINAVTRSGTNTLHGSLYHFIRNSALDAKNYFDSPDEPIPPFKRNQFGASLGGPIRKDHIFFFGNYEGLRARTGLSLTPVVPSLKARQGILRDGPVKIAETVKPYLAWYPIPRPEDEFKNDIGLALYSASPTEPLREDYFMTRVDTQLSERDFLFVRYGMSDSFKGTPQLVPTTTFTNEGRRQWVALGLDRIFSPNLLNTFRAGFTRNSDLDDSYFNIDVDPKRSFVPGLPPGRITISGGVSTVGSHNWSPRRYHQNQFEYSDSVQYQRGLHAFKMGAMVKRVQSNPMVQTNLRGQFSFANLRAFLEGKPNTYSGIAVNGYPYGYRQTIMGFYAQDDYRVHPNLTLNLGLRWEFSLDPTEVNGKFANYVDIYTDTAPHVGKGIELTKKNIQPRVGFAWSLSDKTAIRGGAGLYHETAYPILYTNYSSTLQPFHWDLRVRNPGFPDPFAGGTVLADPPGGWPRELVNKSPSKLQYNLNVQHEILPNTNLTVGYIGAQMRHTPLQTFPNERRPTLRNGVHYWEPNAPLVNPALGELRYACRCGSGNYNGLVVSLNRRPAGLFGFQISYTWSKNLDYNSTIAGVETETSTSNVMNPYDIKSDYARSVFDVRHAFVFNHTLSLPSTNLGGAAGAILNGWGLRGILRATTGTPMNIAAGANRSRNSRTVTGAGDDRPDLVPGRSNNPILGDPYLWYDPTAFRLANLGYFGNLGRNTVTGPGLFNYDFSITRGFPISERTDLEFRSEFFNFFNTPHFGVPGRSVFTTTGARNATAGRILSTVGDSRQIQFSLKLTF